ncbi:type II toxin-antitoxin system HipA family toxin [Erwinia sp. JUb26]|uniref:type II toxin-antitoxin system HipA family toxin n=1 Tax=Erwinia sp. JUb26 TaxID=2485126 RepID=UPI000F4764BC|nr:type II toxin-antitoxin system HipA family toxin [Erwinia sp. JUb26]ROR09965.1 serine/threonine-protein kinase HipA [Erwinia sp. JUb26]
MKNNYVPLRRLEVIYEGWGEHWVLGTLAEGRQRGEWLFEYSAQSIDRGIEFSPLLHPPVSTTYADFERHQEGIPGFIADSLPDGWGRLLMDRLLRRNAIEPAALSPLDRLAMLGSNTMGALTYRPVMEVPGQAAEQHTINDLLLLAREIEVEVAGLDSDVLPELVRLGGSPHGARPKVLLDFDPASGKIQSSPFAGSDPWLIKFPAAQEAAWVCALEEVYARLARKAGIEFPESRWFALGDGLSAFGVKRFDRQQGMRVPTISMAGALQADFRLPCLDYSDILQATAMITRSATEREAQARRMVFNVIVNNQDDHAKNFAFSLNQNEEWRLSPAYDITFQSGPGGQHQSSVAGHGKNISRRALMTAAKSADISEKTMNRIIEEVCDVAAAFVATAKELGDAIPAAVLNEVNAKIKASIRAL